MFHGVAIELSWAILKNDFGVARKWNILMDKIEKIWAPVSVNCGLPQKYASGFVRRQIQPQK